jgi:hypothetical protein
MSTTQPAAPLQSGSQPSSAPAAAATPEIDSAKEGGSGGDQQKQGGSSKIADWIVDNPKLFFGGLLSLVLAWAIRSNVSDHRETALVRALEADSPLASKEIGAISRLNHAPAHVFAAAAAAILHRAGTPAIANASEASVSYEEAQALLRHLLHAQGFADALAEVCKQLKTAEAAAADAAALGSAAAQTDSTRAASPAASVPAAAAPAPASRLSPAQTAARAQLLAAATALLPCLGRASALGRWDLSSDDLLRLLPIALDRLAQPTLPVVAAPAETGAGVTAAVASDGKAADGGSRKGEAGRQTASLPAGSGPGAGVTPPLLQSGPPLVGFYALERAAQLLAAAYPMTDAAVAAAAAAGYAPISLLHTQELRHDRRGGAHAIAAAAHEAEEEGEEGVHSKPGAWLHDTVLEHALSPVHFAYEPVPEHEMHRPHCSLPLPGGGLATNGIAGGGAGGAAAAGDAVAVHPLLLLSLLGVTMGCAPEPLPKAPVPVDAAAAAPAAADATKAAADGGSAAPSAAAAAAAGGSVPSEATLPAAAATPPAPLLPAEPSLPQPRSREEPLPTPTQRLALYLSLVRAYRQQQQRAENGSASSDASAAPAVVLASLLVAAPADGTLVVPSTAHASDAAAAVALNHSRSATRDATPAAGAQPAATAETAAYVHRSQFVHPNPSVYTSSFSAAEVCDLIDLLAATWQIPPRFRVYEPKGLARRWPLPTQSLKPSPVHLREAFKELKLHKEKERPVSVTGTATAPAAAASAAGPALADAAAVPAAAGSGVEFPWRTWQYADASPVVEAAAVSAAAASTVDARRAALRRRATALALAGDVPTEDAALPSLSRELSFEEVRRLMFSRAVCAWGECLVSEYEGRRTSNKWL